SPTPGTPKTISTTVYDSLGNAHQATITYTPDTAGAAKATSTAPTNPVPLASGGNLVNNVLTPAGATFTGANNPVTITVKVTAAGTATITDNNGNSTSGAPNSTVSIDGTSFQ